jgi:hypothetical protein
MGITFEDDGIRIAEFEAKRAAAMQPHITPAE